MKELVSVIMPTTSNREALRSLACKCFIQQDYENKELIIVEDEGNIGHKLNLACERAKGNILIRFDDDDWSDSTRITSQVNLLNKMQLVGYNSIYFWDINKKVASQYKGAKNYCLGTSMCFTREYWESNKFPDSSMGEDLEFQKKAKAANLILSVPADQMMVARIHGNNTGSGRLPFPQVAKEKLPQQFFLDIGG